VPPTVSAPSGGSGRRKHAREEGEGGARSAAAATKKPRPGAPQSHAAAPPTADEQEEEEEEEELGEAGAGEAQEEADDAAAVADALGSPDAVQAANNGILSSLTFASLPLSEPTLAVRIARSRPPTHRPPALTLAPVLSPRAPGAPRDGLRPHD